MFVSQAAQDRSSADQPRAGAGRGDAGSRARIQDSWPMPDWLAGVVVLLELGQDRAGPPG